MINARLTIDVEMLDLKNEWMVAEYIEKETLKHIRMKMAMLNKKELDDYNLYTKYE